MSGVCTELRGAYCFVFFNFQLILFLAFCLTRAPSAVQSQTPNLPWIFWPKLTVFLSICLLQALPQTKAKQRVFSLSTIDILGWTCLGSPVSL